MIDYTQLPIGTMTPDGPTVECPYCGKPAVEGEANGLPFYNHGVRWETVDGKLILVDETHPSPEDLP
jgi:hypothetical protein